MEKAMILIQTSSYGRLFIPWTWLALDMFYSSPDCRRLSSSTIFPFPVASGVILRILGQEIAASAPK